MKPTEETWNLWSYEGPNNGGGGKVPGRHGASVCIGTIAESIAAADEGRPENHECLMTVLGDSELQAVQRACLASAAPELYRALEAMLAVPDNDSDEAIRAHHSSRRDAEAALKKARGGR